MEAELRHHLTTCAAAFAAITGLQVVTIGRRAAKDWRFFGRIAAGEGFTARKYDDVMNWFDRNWPDGEPWPADVPRPGHAPGAAA